ncbi:FUSC family protein [Acetobacter orientalis]|uniref:FUSC family protein n=1 Tax=Acetobacter orientalis TaxID=146474 RepID=UPI00209F4983|nr:FUSC family protein [Acetobacter orientalis]MCP1214665.1 FUSC family protein [Acetobacter orientalis]MCP1218248.1 FUSC family protein [Acetobacter orientalis]
MTIKHPAAATVGFWKGVGVRLPQGVFPPGWFLFCLRTWLSVVLALATAFWLQLSSPGASAVTVMILAQPLRGQVLSKAVYRLVGTFVGAFVALLLTACFNQERGIFLGGVALWLTFCTIIGTLEKDFRAYAAMLSGYTVAIVGISCIDNPASVFTVTINRVSDIVVGIAATAAVNDFFGSPTAWEKLAANLHRTANMVRRIAREAIAGHGIPDEAACAGLAGEIIALTTQVSYAKTELPDAHIRLAGARSAMVALLEMLSCSRAIAYVLRQGEVSGPVLTHIRTAFGDGTPIASPRQAVADLEDLARQAHTTEHAQGPTLDEAWLIERSMALLSDARWAVDGIDAFENGSRARTTAPDLKIDQHHDVIAALLAGLRTLVGFSIAAGQCIISDIPATYTALSQVAIILTLAATTYNARGYGMGALIGTPLAVLVAAVLNFGVLPQGADMPFLAMAIIPVVFAACLLLMNPKTATIGFNAGVFFFVILGVANQQNYEPSAFIDRNVLYLFAAIVIFISLVLLLPPSANKRRFRVAITIGHDLRKQFEGHGEQAGSALISRHYDRLCRILEWNSYLPANKAKTRVFTRLSSLDELNVELARARRHLLRAATIPSIRADAEAAYRSTIIYNIDAALYRMRHKARLLLEHSADLPHGQMATALAAVSSMVGAIRLLEHNRSAINLYDLLPIPDQRWRAF